MSPSESQSGSAATGIPWLTYLLIGVFVVSFEGAQWSSRTLEAASHSELDAAVEYLEAHPYLDAGTELLHRLGKQVDAQRSRYEAEADQRGAPPIPAGIERRQQETLDALVAEAVAGRGESPAGRFGLVPAAPRPGRFLSYVFLHAGWFHLLGNLLLLLVVGVHLEAAWGPLRLALFAAAAAAAAGAVGVVSAPNLDLPLIGTSGLVAALLGAFAVRFASGSGVVYAMVMLAGAAWFGIGSWLGVQWSVADLSAGSDPLPDARACLGLVLGGFGSGAIAAALLGLLGVEAPASGASGGSRRSRAANTLLEKALEAQSRGRSPQAFELLTRALDEDPNSPDVSLALWDVALSLGRSAEAAGAMLRVLRDDLHRGDRRAVVDHWLELDERGLSGDADATLLIRIAAVLRDEDQPNAALGALQLALSQGERSGSPVVASRVARAARDLDPETAKDAAWRALGSADLSYDQRRGLEEMLGDLFDVRGRDPDLQPLARGHSYGKQDPRSPAERDQPPEAAEADGAGADAAAQRPQPIELEVGERALELHRVTPIGLEDEGLRIELPDGRKRLLSYRTVDAVAVSAVHGLAAKPVILIDLVLNWMSLRDEALKVVRLRGDRFDPHLLCPGHDSALAAVRDFLGRLIERTGATPLPDDAAAHGRPFAVLSDLATYQRDVLMADGEPKA